MKKLEKEKKIEEREKACRSTPRGILRGGGGGGPAGRGEGGAEDASEARERVGGGQDSTCRRASQGYG